MSRQIAALPLALLAASSLGACATLGGGGASSETVVDASGAPPGARPIDRRAREQVAREDSLTQMAFWAAEYQTFPNDIEAAQRFSEALRRGGRTDRAMQIAGEALSRFPEDRAPCVPPRAPMRWRAPSPHGRMSGSLASLWPRSRR